MKLQSLSPLTEASYYILISLTEPLHGYGVMKRVEEYSNGRVRLAPGTLYGALSTLTRHGLITVTDDSGRRNKKVYAITRQGRNLVEYEIARLEEMYVNGKLAIDVSKE